MSLPFHPNRDNERISSERINQFLHAAQYYVPKARLVLDIGCGHGDLVHASNAAGIRMLGVDLRDVFLYDRQWFVHADAAYLPFKSRSVDVICEHFFIDDIMMLQEDAPRKIIAALAEMQRVLKKGGAVISSPQWYNFAPELGCLLVSDAYTYKVYKKK
ncbi:MAG: class I SAM-dependent methyltransferase [archaeon]